MNPWDAIKDAIIDAVRQKGSAFIDANQDVKDFLEDRVERLAKLTYKYQLANIHERVSIADSLETVRNTIELDLGTLAIKASLEQKALFSAVLSSVLGTVVKILPTLL